ncbi:MAG TPA: helix-turn-helix domain-containing protein [Nitrospiria bacterium]|nr:helix-turn-helix domain-containing protein [Nitrospiria bacterium]
MSGNGARHGADPSIRNAVERLERDLITRSLADANGSQSAAARRLGISERVLRYKMKKYGIVRSTKVSVVDKSV